MITLREIAADLGLDCGTVSHILNHDDPRYNAATRKRVRDYAAKKGYRPNAIARAMRSKKTGIIGFLFRQEPGKSLSSEYYYMRVIEGVESELLDEGYKVLLASVSKAEIAECRIPTVWSDGFVEGLIVLGTSDEAWLKAVHAACKNLVVVDESPEGIPSVVCDNFEGGRTAAAFLWEQGHRNIAIITGEKPNRNFEARVLGFNSLIAERLQTAVDLPIYRGDVWGEGGARAVAEILQRRHVPTAVFCVNDYLAIHSMKAFQAAGMNVPRDISILGFDNTIPSGYSQPALTTMAVEKVNMGREAARMMLERIKGNGRRTSLRKELAVHLKERDSVSRRPVDKMAV